MSRLSLAGSSPQVLFLSGLGADHRLTELLLPLDARRAKAFDCVTPDYIAWRRGESLTEYAERFFQHLVNTHTVDVQRVCYIVGISMGGAFALEIAKRQRVKGIALVGSFVSRRELAGYVRFSVRWIAPYVPDWIYRALTPIVPIVLNGVSRVPPESIAVLQSMYASMPYAFFGRACRGVAGWQGTALPSFRQSRHNGPLADANAPHLFRIHGEDDHIIPLDNTCSVNVIVKDAKHLVSVSHTNVVRDALVDEIQSCLEGTSP